MPILGFGTTRIHVSTMVFITMCFVTITVYTLRFFGFLSRSRRYIIIIVCKNCNLYALLHAPSPQVVANCLKVRENLNRCMFMLFNKVCERE